MGPHVGGRGSARRSGPALAGDRQVPTAVNRSRSFPAGSAWQVGRCMAAPRTNRCPPASCCQRDGGAPGRGVAAPARCCPDVLPRVSCGRRARIVIAHTSTDSGANGRPRAGGPALGPLSTEVRIDRRPARPDRPAWLGQRIRQAQLPPCKVTTAFCCTGGRRADDGHQVTPGGQPTGPVGPAKSRSSARRTARPGPRQAGTAPRAPRPSACSTGRPPRRSTAPPHLSLPALPPWQLTQVTSLDAVSGRSPHAIRRRPGLTSPHRRGGCNGPSCAPAPAPTGPSTCSARPRRWGHQESRTTPARSCAPPTAATPERARPPAGVVTQLDFRRRRRRRSQPTRPEPRPGRPPWELLAQPDGGLTWQPRAPSRRNNRHSGRGSPPRYGLLSPWTLGISWEARKRRHPDDPRWTHSRLGSRWTPGGIAAARPGQPDGHGQLHPGGGLVQGVGG